MSDVDLALAHIRLRERARRRMAELDQERARGVCWSGCGPEPRPAQRSERDLRAEAAARSADLREWRASGQGRFSSAVGQAFRAAERVCLAVETVRAALARGDDSVLNRCREAADALEAQGLDMVSAAQAARRALPQETPRTA
jgi:hypothetical protein